MSGRLSTNRDPPRAAAKFLPWTDNTGRAWPGRHRWWRCAPFIVTYLVAAWALFFQAARPNAGHWIIDNDRLGPFLYRIPDLADAPTRILTALPIAPWLNHNEVQIVYVTIVLLIFGIRFEMREGTTRTVGLYFGTTIFGALFAGMVMHLLYPELWRDAFITREWNQVWSGGSVGCYGLVGGMVARARRPWLLLIAVVFWEANLVYWYLREYTPVFHLSAFAAGFAVTRVALVPWPRMPPDADNYPAPAGQPRHRSN
jgi:hypothetical protein